MLTKKTNIIVSMIIFLSFVFSAAPVSAIPSYEVIFDLNPVSDKMKNFRKDVRNTIIVVKGKKSPDDMPELKFYKYVIKNNESFWKILSQTALNIDTLSSINLLNSPNDMAPGKTIFISNMRGVLYKVSKGDTLDSISEKYKIPVEYILKVNKITTLSKKYLFIPCAEKSNSERSDFLGGGFSLPVSFIKLNSGFGYRNDPFVHKVMFHTGLDMDCTTGTKVRASKKGTVAFTGESGNYGNLVIINHENGYESYYGHLSRIIVKPGQTVETGQVIALSGNTGRSTGPHLHFEIRKNNMAINPAKMLRR